MDTQTRVVFFLFIRDNLGLLSFIPGEALYAFWGSFREALKIFCYNEFLGLLLFDFQLINLLLSVYPVLFSKETSLTF